MNPPRRAIPDEVQKRVLVASLRRCCLCYFIEGKRGVRKGQIAHLSRDPSRISFDDLVWLCLDHHAEFDGKTSQEKGLTPGEVRHHRDELYKELASSAPPQVAGEQFERREEPPVRVSLATSESGTEGFVWVYNPGVAEKFCVRLRGFEANNLGLELSPTWSTGEDERIIKRGDKDSCLIMKLEPDRVPFLFSSRGERVIPLGMHDALKRERDRRARGVRIVRFVGNSYTRDIEVVQGSQYWVEVVVLSDTREPVCTQVTYGVGAEMIIMPFDQSRIDSLVEKDRKLRLELEELIKRPHLEQGEPESE